MGKLSTAYFNSFIPNFEYSAEFKLCIDDLIRSHEVQSLQNYFQHQRITRLEHITSVAFLSFLICRRLGLDYEEAARGGLLHDLFFYDWHESDSSHRLHGFRHPGFALANAREIFGPLSPKTENIIQRHMWPLTPIPPKYREALIVCLVDKYCATQEVISCKSKRRRQRYGFSSDIR